MQLEYEPIPEWPPLAWLAVCDEQSSVVKVYHGEQVETSADWFGEVVWAGEFADGDFDRVEVVSGSGGRCREKEIVFVPASSTVERLNSIRLGRRTLISNSLPCALNASGATLRPGYSGYNRFMSSIRRGLDKYERFLPTSRGDLQLTYYEHLVWDGNSLSVRQRPDSTPDFTDFRSYERFLDETMERFSQNARDAGRLKQRYGMLVALSSGYDSSTVAAVMARHGGEVAVTIEQGVGGVGDSGVKIAEALGLRVIPVNRKQWLDAQQPEVPVIAGGILSSVVFASVVDHIRGNVLMTGYLGDKVWGLECGDTSDKIVREDTSGLGLGEYRLWNGFIHCPVPFWGIRKVGAVNRISHLPEMEPFMVEGDYNRPISRRIVEEAGVGRDQFGTSKKAVELFVWQEKDFLTPESMKDYLGWLRENQWDWVRHFRLPPIRSTAIDALLNNMGSLTAAAVRTVSRAIVRLCRRIPGLPEVRLEALANMHPRLMNLRRYYFGWAMDRATKRYAAFSLPDEEPPNSDSAEVDELHVAETH